MKGCKSHDSSNDDTTTKSIRNGWIIVCSMVPVPRSSVGFVIPILVVAIGWFLRQQQEQPQQSILLPTNSLTSSLLSFSSSSSVVVEDELEKKKVKELERGKYISDKMTAKELYEAYLDIKNDYQEKAFSTTKNKNNNEWKVLKKTQDGIEISMLSHPSDPSCPYVRMRAIMPGSVQHVWNFLALENWEQTMPHMDPFYEGLDIYQTYTYHPPTNKHNHRPSFFGSKQKNQVVQMILARKRTKRLLTFGKRDFTFLSVSDIPEPQKDHPLWISGTLSVITPTLFPTYPGYTRAFQDSIAFYEPYYNNNNNNNNNNNQQTTNQQQQQTSLNIVCRIDLNDNTKNGQGGAIPMWIYVKTIGNTGVLSIQNMRKQLLLQSNKIIKKQEIIQTFTSPSSNPLKTRFERFFQPLSNKTS